MDPLTRLQILSTDSQYDLACACGSGNHEHRKRTRDGSRWLYPVPLAAGGRGIMFKTLLSNCCVNDCKYCPLRGDANAVADEGYVSEDGIVGAYYGAKVPYLGGGLVFLGSAEGLCLLATALYFSAISSALNSRLKQAEARRREVLRAAAEERASGAAEV